MNLTERIESVILSNLQPPAERKIGIECESMFYDTEMQRIPVNPSGKYSSTDLLNELEDLQANDAIKVGYSLEPGGQLEWASPPMKSLHEINEKHVLRRERLSKILQREGLSQLNYSVEPIYKPTDIELINHDKYRLMNKMFIKTGNLGQWMMRNTTSVQINLDFSSQQEAERMAFIADSLMPLSSILFANSPFWKGKSAGKDNIRYKIWNNTDSSRCGDLAQHGMKTSKNLIHNYAKYIQRVPAIFIIDEKNNIVESGETLGSWLSQLEKEGKLTDDHIQTALHQIFTHVRFKNVLEIRGSDKPPIGFEMAPAAFWVGLMFDDSAQQRTHAIVSSWSSEDRQRLNTCAQNLDLNQMGPQNKSISGWIGLFCDISLEGLKARSVNYHIEDESQFLRQYYNKFVQHGVVTLHVQKKQLLSNQSLQQIII